MTELNKTVSVIGLGYIGLPFCAALANVGYKVIGVDIDNEKISMLKRGEVGIHEPGLKETLDKYKQRIEYTVDGAYAVQNSDIIFVTVGTPVNENDEPDYRQLDSCIEIIGKNLRNGQLVMLKSTVIIGTTEDYVSPRLEKISGLKAGEDFYLVFCPERTIEGLALHEIYNLPKIIGGINKESSIIAEKIMRRFGGKTKIVSSPRAAEMCKLVDNLYRTTNIAFANEMGMLCEKIGIDAEEVVSAVNSSYPRTNLFRPGLGADGPCLSKDPIIFRQSAMKSKIATPVIDGCIIQNRFSTYRIAEMVKQYILKNSLDKINLTIIGLAFKGFPETDDLRGSPAIKILDVLKKEKIHLDAVKLYDPLVKKFMNYELSESMGDALADSNVILFLTNHPQIMNVDIEDISKKISKPAFIIDAWNNIEAKNIPEGINYFRIGKGN